MLNCLTAVGWKFCGLLSFTSRAAISLSYYYCYYLSKRKNCCEFVYTVFYNE